MTFDKAIEMLRVEYERAQKLTFVRNPLAWALHRVWRVVDRQKQEDT